jgi:hypothetical protein
MLKKIQTEHRSCLAQISKHIVSFANSDLCSVWIFFSIEKIRSLSALLFGRTTHARANIDKLGNCKFQADWMKDFQFLWPSSLGNESSFCTLCSVNFSDVGTFFGEMCDIKELFSKQPRYPNIIYTSCFCLFQYLWVRTILITFHILILFGTNKWAYSDICQFWPMFGVL